MRFRPRFSLKVLMLFVAAMAIFCAYHVNWIRQRHEVFAEISAQRIAIENRHGPHEGGPVCFDRRTSSFNLLWLFGEQRHERLTLALEEPLSVFNRSGQNIVQAIINLHKQELERAKNLFPEAGIFFEVYWDER